MINELDDIKYPQLIFYFKIQIIFNEVSEYFQIINL